MKKCVGIGLALFVTFFLLYGCNSASTHGAAEQSAPHSGSDVTESEASSPLESALPVKTESIYRVHGNYIEVTDGFWKSRERLTDAEHLGLTKVEQTGGFLVFLWNLYNGDEGPVPVEVIDPCSSEIKRQEIMEGRAYDLRITGENEYRITFADRLEYRRTDDFTFEKTIPFPQALTEDVWIADYFSGSPFDAEPKADLIAYSSQAGIMLCDLEGNEAEIKLSNTTLPSVMENVEMPNHETSQLRYVNPLFLGKGKYLVATIYMTGDESGKLGGYEGRPYGISILNLETGETTHTPDNFVWLANPAKRMDDDCFVYLGDDGYNIVYPANRKVETTDYNPLEAASYDFKTIIQTEPTDEPVRLYAYPAEAPKEQKTLLEGELWINIGFVTKDYVVCSVIQNDEEHILIVPYES